MCRRLAAWGLAVVAAAMLAACSTASVAYRNARTLYDNAPTLILWSLDDYLDLADTQKSLARERLQKALAWHRRNALPGYADFLASLDAQVDAGLTEETLRGDQERLRGYYRDIAEHLLPDAADLFATFDAAQVDELEERLAKADRRMIEEAAASRSRAMGRTLGHIEAWTGPLSGAQRELVKSRLRARPDLTRQRVAEWRVRQARLIALMRARPSRDEMVLQLHALLFDVEAAREPRYAQAVRDRDAAMIAMLAELARTLDPAQVANVKERIRGLQSDIARATRES
jgi:hypothetical protein